MILWATGVAAQSVHPIPQSSSSPPPPSVSGSTTSSLTTVLAAPAITVPSGVAVGRTAGSFAVSSTGAAAYSIPLWTPPGITGLQPSLTLTYNSSTGNGLLGVGWSLSGLSTISRCYKTVAQDGVDGTPDLASTDLFCIDGNKLRSFNGTTYGADGSFYQTEIADFSLIISHGTAGVGPAWFEVYAKNGLIYEYGNTVDSALLASGSQSALAWALNKIRDRNGNHIDFVYTNDAANHVQRPLTITYTTSPGSAAPPQYQITFGTETRPDPLNWYFVGTLSQESNRINQISISAFNGSTYALARAYYLSYGTGSTGYSRISSIQECSATQCFPATTVGYQNSTGGWGANTSVSGVPAGPFIYARTDLNGDGIDDVVYSSGGSIYYLLGQTSGAFGGPYAVGSGCNSGTVLPLNYSGNRKYALLVANSSNNWRICQFSTAGSAFTYTDTSVPVVAGTIAADVDGDGYQDIAYINKATTNKISYRRNLQGTGFATETVIYTASTGETFNTLLDPNTGQSSTRRMDFNGDGRDDFMFYVTYCSTDTGKGCTASQYSYYWTALVSKSDGTYVDGDDFIDKSVPWQPIFGDFNGDGCTDVVFENLNGYLMVSFGACDGRAAAAFSTSTVLGSFSPTQYTKALAADWDGDGRTDLLLYNQATSTWGYAVSTGASFGPWTNLNLSTLNIVGDFNGDGLPDLAGAGTGGINYLLHAGIAADLVTSITDGFGVNFSPTYDVLAKSPSYTKASGAVFPEVDFSGAMWIVPSYTASDGVGGTFTITETYYGARINAQGRGFEGFLWKQSKDSRSNWSVKDNFALTFPNTGQLSERTVYQANGSTAVSDLTNTVASYTLDSTSNNQRYFPYVNRIVSSAYEVNGALNGSLISQVTKTVSFSGANGYSYGNPSQITTTTVDKDPTSPWYGNVFTDTANVTPHETGLPVPSGWCIGLADGVTETRATPTNGTITRTRSYSVSSDGLCRIVGQTVEPNSTSGQKTSSSIGYDACNNVNSVSVTGQNPDGTNMATRTSTASYGTRCLLPEVKRDALGHTTNIGYRYDLALPTSIQDPNLLSTTVAYNDLGQKTLLQKPDNTQTQVQYFSCSGSSCLSDSLLRYWTRSTLLDGTSGHGTISYGDVYYDQLGRLKYSRPLQENGVQATSARSYDSFGHLVSQTSPYGNGFSSYTTTMAYDLLGRVTQRYRPTSASNPTPEYTNYTYQGRTFTVQDPRGYTTIRQSDALGELLRVTDPDGVSKTTYAYGPFGNVQAIGDPTGNTITRTYDSLGYHLTGSSDSDRGTWVYQYDSLGELLKVRDAKTAAPSWTQQLSYDALGRTLTRVESEGTTTWSWDTATNGIGLLASVSGLGDTEQFAYDAFSRLSTHTQTWSGVSYAIDYAYNTLGALDTLTYPSTPLSANRFAVKYGYTNGYLSSVQNYTGGVGGTLFWELTPGTVSIDPWGHVIDETLGTTAATRIQSSFDMVTSGIVTRQVGSGGSTNNLQNLAYSWDQNGNLTQRQDLIQNLTESFTYDNLNRVQSSALNGTQNLSMAYDAAGNIATVLDPALSPSQVSYTYDATHKHAVSSAYSNSYTYDANGNMATRAGSTIMWSSANQPISIAAANGQSSTFWYGPDRQRKQQTATYAADGTNGTETTTYVGGLFEVEATPAQTHYKHFISAPGGSRIIYDLQSVSGTQVTYVTNDHLGSSSLMLNSAGTPLLHESYSAFGYRRNSNWSGQLPSSSSDYNTIASTTRRGYTDAFHEMLDNVGLIHMNGRLYDPIIGRFISADAVVARLGASQSGNPYSYVENAPLALIDPSGFAPKFGPRSGCDSDCIEWWVDHRSLEFQKSGLGDYADFGGMPPIWSFTGAGWFWFSLGTGWRSVNGDLTPQTWSSYTAANIAQFSNMASAGPPAPGPAASGAAASGPSPGEMPEVVVTSTRVENADEFLQFLNFNSTYMQVGMWSDRPLSIPRSALTLEQASAGGFQYVWATREGLVGRITASEHVVGAEDLFAALPSREALGRTIEIQYGGTILVVPILDVGPWNTKDPYWLTNTRPQAESGFDLSGRPTNGAGIDISNSAFNQLGLTGNSSVYWKFVQ
jgi:RHS repeat-associated protein